MLPFALRTPINLFPAYFLAPNICGVQEINSLKVAGIKLLPFPPELGQLQWNADSKITHAKVPDNTSWGKEWDRDPDLSCWVGHGAEGAGQGSLTDDPVLCTLVGRDAGGSSDQ